MGIDAQMFVKNPHPLSEKAVLELAWECAAAFGDDRFWIWNPKVTGREYAQHALNIVTEYQQDGPTLKPERGEQFIEAHPATRYYGRGYERGDLPFLIALAHWLEVRIPGGQVWYGGDSSGVNAEPFDAVEREALMRHFISVGHMPYVGDPRVSAHDNPYIKQPTYQPRCDFCQQPMHQCGFGHAYARFDCLGCDYSVETRDDGQTWKTPKKDTAHA